MAACLLPTPGCRKVLPSGHRMARHKIFCEAQFWWSERENTSFLLVRLLFPCRRQKYKILIHNYSPVRHKCLPVRQNCLPVRHKNTCLAKIIIYALFWRKIIIYALFLLKIWIYALPRHILPKNVEGEAHSQFPTPSPRAHKQVCFFQMYKSFPTFCKTRIHKVYWDEPSHSSQHPLIGCLVPSSNLFWFVTLVCEDDGL